MKKTKLKAGLINPLVELKGKHGPDSFFYGWKNAFFGSCEYLRLVDLHVQLIAFQTLIFCYS
jgi:hypothetical protein